MDQQNNPTNQIATAAVVALAAASATPFKTAFKIYFGIGLAQLALIGLFFGATAGVILTICLAIHILK